MILVTGASGFVGRAVVARLAASGPGVVRGAVRRPVELPAHAERAIVGDLGPDTDWTEALRGVDTVIHAAARVHVLREVDADPEAQFQRVNVEGTRALARQAAAAGVRRFVFISSIKVNGEQTDDRPPFTADDVPAPLDAYGRSKADAEAALREISAQSGMEVTLIRPVLVYGPGVRANFRAMVSWVARGVPLPLGAIHNRRSLVALPNLVDLIVTCTRHPSAANQAFLVSDGEDLSTSELLRRVAKALGRPARLLPVPAALLRLAATLTGQGDVGRRLFGSLQVDIAKTRTLLGWTPPVSVDEGLRQAVHREPAA